MKGIFSLVILVFTSLILRSETVEVTAINVNQEEDVKSVTKKSFDDEAYQKFTEDVNLIEELEKRKLKEDSSLLGKGYGVEYGKDYIIYTFDSISVDSITQEKSRGPGSSRNNDGINPNQRNKAERDAYVKKLKQKRQRNIEQKVREEQLKKKEKENKSRSERSASGDGSVSSLLLYVLLAIALGAVIYLVFMGDKSSNGSKKVHYENDFNPNQIELSALEVQINEAKANNDFRLATRLYFVWIIKELSDQGFIDWKKRKTNHNYLLEVAGKSFYNSFSNCIKTYEFVWYGEYALSEEDFKNVENDFKQLVNIIKKGNHN